MPYRTCACAFDTSSAGNLLRLEGTKVSPTAHLLVPLRSLLLLHHVLLLLHHHVLLLLLLVRHAVRVRHDRAAGRRTAGTRSAVTGGQAVQASVAAFHRTTNSCPAFNLPTHDLFSLWPGMNPRPPLARRSDPRRPLARWACLRVSGSAGCSWSCIT